MAVMPSRVPTGLLFPDEFIASKARQTFAMPLASSLSSARRGVRKGLNTSTENAPSEGNALRTTVCGAERRQTRREMQKSRDRGPLPVESPRSTRVANGFARECVHLMVHEVKTQACVWLLPYYRSQIRIYRFAWNRR